MMDDLIQQAPYIAALLILVYLFLHAQRERDQHYLEAQRQRDELFVGAQREMAENFARNQAQTNEALNIVVSDLRRLYDESVKHDGAVREEIQNLGVKKPKRA